MSSADPRRVVRVRVPATSANLGPGFDTLGLALDLHDEIEMSVADSGCRVAVVGEGASDVGEGADNLVVRAACAAFDRLGVTPPGLDVGCHNRIPQGRGLGSSAAAIVAGVSAAAALARDLGAAAMSPAEVFALAVELEGHPDNVAACLSGGLAVAWRAEEAHRWVRLEPHPLLSPVAFVPDGTLSTRAARGLLPEHVTHADAAANAGRAALLVAALTTGRTDLLMEATEDRLHQGYRAPAMPDTVDLLAKLRAVGVAAVLSGAGPTILTLAGEISQDRVSAAAGTSWQVRRLGLDRGGACVETDNPSEPRDTPSPVRE